ncbi:FapA family protein [Desulfovibrio psychrotolerans]|uniref:Flagellar Assembly Protein A N-terminal region domain-containing protein n=1 Tax=Desulfovibrio psychrotolerans TaxID=415242 RepID=A0A7J0BU20_9BACT|nr:FapA family protein [Desulfovibrio psychrotolerans]GFM37203.1 hypothetical protein DSM19430T_18870 [Desulfovibrio psychrotolerans]
MTFTTAASGRVDAVKAGMPGAAVRHGADTAATGTGEDAMLRFSGTQDRMKVGVARYIPPSGGGRPLTVERIRKLLAEAGVKVPLSEKGAEKLLHCISTGGAVDRIVIARGVQPENGKDAYIVPYGNFNYPVFPGQAIGNLVAAVMPKPGMRVDGSEIPPHLPHKPRDIVIGENGHCVLDPASRDISSTVFGLVQATDTAISVTPLVSVSEDAMQASVRLHFRDMEGAPLTKARVLGVLHALHVPVALVDQAAIEEALERCERTGKPSEPVVLARGRQPVHGRDGYVEMLSEEREAAPVGMTKANGAIDFRNRGLLPSARAGAAVAVVHPPTRGVAGVDVLGNVLPANDGQPAKVTLDRSVALDADGKTVLAQVDGLAQYVGGTLSVQEVVQVDGDVDFSTGNIHVATGSVRVKGTVLSGFSVKTPGSLVVGAAIESARIMAGGNVEVAGGILMMEKGYVRCGGSVHAGFVNEAVIEARDDVVVRDFMLHSTVLCGGRVIATTGRGRIQGGSITCMGGVEALELGAELGVATKVTVAVSSKALRELEKERDTVKEALIKLTAKFGEGAEEELLMRARPEQYKAIEAALALRETLTNKYNDLREQVAEARVRASAKLLDKRVAVSGVVHPGTVITIGEAVFTVSHPIQAAVFRYVPESRRIEVVSA